MLHSPSRGRRWLATRSLVFLLACALAYTLEHAAESYVEGENGASSIGHSLFSVRNLYQYLVAAWPRTMVPRYSVILMLDPDADPTAAGLADNVCDQRGYLARLLPALAEREPAVIVIDKFFVEAGCAKEEPTRQLKEAIGRVGARVPVVVGLSIERRRDAHVSDPTHWPAARRPLNFPAAALLREAIVNTDEDSRRIPLGWTILRGAGEAPRWFDGLALAAAEAYDAKLWTKYPRLEHLRQTRSNPYLSMIAPQDHVYLYAGEMLCASTTAQAGFEAPCASLKRSGTDPAYLRGRIVLVGQMSNDIDRHATVIGNVQGVVLQANYLEALLDERYFSPVPAWVDYLVGFLVFIGIEASLRHPSIWGSLLRLVLVLAGSFLVLSLAVRYLGYYVNPVTVSVLVLSIKLIGWLAERINQVGESHHGS
jgi:CHASE2 domain-containing sensor protein